MIKGTLHPTHIHDARITDFISAIDSKVYILEGKYPNRFEIELYGVLCEFSSVDIKFKQFIEELVKSFYEEGYTDAIHKINRAVQPHLNDVANTIEKNWTLRTF